MFSRVPFSATSMVPAPFPAIGRVSGMPALCSSEAMRSPLTTACASSVSASPSDSPITDHGTKPDAVILHRRESSAENDLTRIPFPSITAVALTRSICHESIEILRECSVTFAAPSGVDESSQDTVPLISCSLLKSSGNSGESRTDASTSLSAPEYRRPFLFEIVSMVISAVPF